MQLKAIEFKPLFDDLLVIELKPERERSGIIIPETVNEKKHIALVVSVGHGRIDRMTGTLKGMLPKVGDVVKFREVPEELVEVSGDKFLHIKEFDIEGFYTGSLQQQYRSLIEGQYPQLFTEE
jgi:co-chaperonin GroES (HSP10)